MTDDEEECQCPDPPPGLPGWLATFADLMSLLLCFFVLLLTFSEIDAMKYKQIADTMKEAFGVQKVIKDKDIPKGTSVIMRHFSPGKPEPTPLNMVRQFTTDLPKPKLDEQCEPGKETKQGRKLTTAGQQQKEISTQTEEMRKKSEAVAEKLTASLKEEVDQGSIEVETRGSNIVIRIQEKGSFGSGAANLRPSFIPTMEKIRNQLATTEGLISVEGHTDSIPIETAEFPSNWALSSARAVVVAHEILADGRILPSRIEVKGFADTRPLVPNNTRENRAKNRRVEIVVYPSVEAKPPVFSEKLPESESEEPSTQDDFRLRPEEVF
ncbi:MotB family protein [Zooshikella harenae]|uniref:OmpA family protein n=1 Tax=Zooshikella harenae TaxID=2827238 RepID=A0ABS5ZFB9_9GAMM|nr:MotB family protein [Zooshikella harenae]MBU2712675.1 OmpA family protein [Zooshikella harenae]